MRQTQNPAAGRTRRRLATIGAGVLAVALIPSLALASNHLATLAGSQFEIDSDANLKNDEGEPWKDWADLAHPDGPEIRATDKATGQNDDSYKGGVKEDTACPGETTGSIPNNKSDLLTFHAYEEPGTAGHPGFFNMAWSRVSDPSGTTLMDFEFNQSGTDCANSPNKVRTTGDLLIEYAIDQGGARADLSARTWTGSAWSSPLDIDAPSAKCPDGDTSNDGGGAVDLGPCAVGTINSSVIPAGEADSLGEKQARTFGEAQIDLRFIFEADKCTSFGSAMVKSRSSDAFTSQLKDFISPVPITLQNCGTVIIRKETEPDGATDNFGFTKDFSTDPVTDATFELSDGESQEYIGKVLFGTGYTVVEDDLPANWALDRIDCDVEGQESEGVTPVIDGAEITFDIDSDDDVLDCTYYNKQLLGAIEITKERKHAADGPNDSPHEGVDFTISGIEDPVTTDEGGKACLDGLPFGDYTVTEDVPQGYVSDDDTKDVTVSASSTCGDGNEATVSFLNTPLTNITVSVDSQVDGGTASTIKCTDADENEYNGSTLLATGDGSLTVNDLLPTDPTVTLTCEITVDP